MDSLTRRTFLSGMTASFALAATNNPLFAAPKKSSRVSKIALKLYSIRGYIKEVGLEKALADVREIGYEGVEFAGYYNFKAKELKKMLADNGLEVCGTHVNRSLFSPERYKRTCDFEREYGNTFICCPGGGNNPPNCRNAPPETPSSPEIDDFIKKLVDYYNKAADYCAKEDCRIGLHNHRWEFFVKMTNGTNFWDYFFSHTDKRVLMEQDVGWTTCVGFDPCVQYKKYPHRSFTLHAKENGMGKGVKKFDGILGQPGQPGAKGVDWNRLFKATDADKVAWYVIECERLDKTLNAVRPSFEFLKSKGRV